MLVSLSISRFIKLRIFTDFGLPIFIGANTELDAVSSFSEIVPDTVVFDDFQKYIVYLLLLFFPFL